MGPHFVILIAEKIMTYSGEPQSQSAPLVNKWPFSFARAREEEWRVPRNCITLPL